MPEQDQAPGQSPHDAPGDALRGEAVEHAPDLGLELVGGRAIDLELAAHRDR